MKTGILKIYLGARVQTPNGIQNLTGVCESYSDPNHIRVQVRNLADNIGHWYDLDEIKLILRPLSSMTEGEKRELALIINPKLTYFEVNIHYTDAISVKTRDNQKTSITDNYTPETFLYLLSKGFDLFGLIESGSVLDGTKL